MTVLWSDESTFPVTDSGGGNVYRWPVGDPLDHRYIQSMEKHPVHLMVWDAFTGYGTAQLQVVPRNVNVNQYTYLDVL